MLGYIIFFFRLDLHIIIFWQHQLFDTYLLKLILKLICSQSKETYHKKHYQKKTGETSRNFYSFFGLLIGCKKAFRNFRTNHSVGSRLCQPKGLSWNSKKKFRYFVKPFCWQETLRSKRVNIVWKLSLSYRIEMNKKFRVPLEVLQNIEKRFQEIYWAQIHWIHGTWRRCVKENIWRWKS